MFLLDISLLFGAQSNFGKGEWFWENETEIEDSNYPPSNTSVCQQMSLSLTYDDGIKLLPKRCFNEEAYFACEVERKLSLLF